MCNICMLISITNILNHHLLKIFIIYYVLLYINVIIQYYKIFHFYFYMLHSYDMIIIVLNNHIINYANYLNMHINKICLYQKNFWEHYKINCIIHMKFIDIYFYYIYTISIKKRNNCFTLFKFLFKLNILEYWDKIKEISTFIIRKRKNIQSFYLSSILRYFVFRLSIYYA